MSLHDELKDMAYNEGKLTKLQKSFEQIEEDLDKVDRPFLKTASLLVAGGMLLTLAFYGAIIFAVAVAVKWVLS
jgi:hypothetical protein